MTPILKSYDFFVSIFFYLILVIKSLQSMLFSLEYKIIKDHIIL